MGGASSESEAPTMPLSMALLAAAVEYALWVLRGLQAGGVTLGDPSRLVA